MNHDANTENLLPIYKVLSEELRHTATVIWQFSIAIITLQGGALALAAKSGYQTVVARSIIATTGFFLPACFSVMLLRQAYERGGFVRLIRDVEVRLREVYPESQFFAPINSPCFLRWFTSVKLAWILVVESLVVFLLFLALSAVYLCSAYFEVACVLVFQALAGLLSLWLRSLHPCL